MNSDKRMKSCYFPTTTVLVDDDVGFLELASAKISVASPCLLFEDPNKALEYLGQKYETRRFFDQFYSNTIEHDVGKTNNSFTINIGNIYKQMYNQTRFSEITGIFVDYAMPGLNGREFCNGVIADCGWKNWNNITLLTGEAKLETGVEMINEKLINGYIYKRDPNYLSNLVETIKLRQSVYFEEFSALIINAIADRLHVEGFRPSCLRDPYFIDFFNTMIEKLNVVEYYLINDSGSYIFLNADGQVSWFIVQSEDDMEAAEFEMRADQSVPPDIYNAIKDRKVIRYFFNEEVYPQVSEPSGWKKYIYPAEVVNGNSNYYYSYIESPLAETFINTSKVASYSDFRNSLHNNEK